MPCLEAAVVYRRAAGYFTSAGLALAVRGVASLALRRGRMRLVVSPHLEADDIAALERAKENSAGVLRSIAARTLAEIEDTLVKDRLNALAWLAAARLLEIKLAIRVSAQGGYPRGLFHAKTGVFSDDAGNHVSFSGSANETAGGLVENFEHLDVFRSWQDQEGRVQAAIDDFEALWTGSAPGLRVIEFSQAGRDLLERYRNPDRPRLASTLTRSAKPAQAEPSPRPSGWICGPTRRTPSAPGARPAGAASSPWPPAPARPSQPWCSPVRLPSATGPWYWLSFAPSSTCAGSRSVRLPPLGSMPSPASRAASAVALLSRQSPPQRPQAGSPDGAAQLLFLSPRRHHRRRTLLRTRLPGTD